MGDPPSIDSPPALEVSAGSLMSNVGSSPAGSTTSNSSYQQTPSKRIPGKLALCKQCGTQSDDLAVCIRCKRKFPEDVKLLDDPAFRPKPDSTDSTAKKSSALRGVRPPNKNRKRNNDEPVCIALSDSEEDGEDDFGDPETIDESSGNFAPILTYLSVSLYFGSCFVDIRTIGFVYIGTIEADRKCCLLSEL